jgi:hypothetical protein
VTVRKVDQTVVLTVVVIEALIAAQIVAPLVVAETTVVLPDESALPDAAADPQEVPHVAAANLARRTTAVTVTTTDAIDLEAAPTVTAIPRMKSCVMPMPRTTESQRSARVRTSCLFVPPVTKFMMILT